MIVLKQKTRELLVRYGLSEIYSRSFVSGGDGAPPLENPASAELTHLRPNLNAGLLESVRSNARFFDTIRIFEIGNVFRSSAKGVLEMVHLGVALAGKKQSPVLELKGVLDDALHGLGLVELSFVHAGASLRVESGRRVLGEIYEEHLPKGWVAAHAEIDLEKLLELVEGDREFRPLPKYPAVMRDLSLFIGNNVRIGEILETIQAASPALVDDVDLIDQYSGDEIGGRSAQLGTNKQSLTFRIVFQSNERTLTDAEVNREMEKITERLKQRFRAEVR
jgi:phenylalanyl-tRNA synthetase beta chain